MNKLDKKLVVSISPHINSLASTPFIMRQVIYSLIPALAVSILFFKFMAIRIVVNSVVSCVVAEYLVNRIRGQEVTVKDGSAVLTGLLLAFSLPPATKWYAVTLGSFFAMIVGKHIFGGLGKNIFNPAMVGRAFLAAAYPQMLTSWTPPFSLDAITTATPLALYKFSHTLSDIGSLFWGKVGGCLGETSAFCLILGGLYIFLREVADWRACVGMLSTIILFALFKDGPVYGLKGVFFHLFSGGVLLGAFFMVTDPVTTPVTKLGRWVFGIGCGLLIMIIRYWGGLPEGVMYSILFMNGLTPIINKLTRPRSFGWVKLGR